MDRPQHFEAVEVGDSYDLPDSYEVTKEEIIDFAQKYDPQPFHVDEQAAADSMFGELVASGWHTCAMAMRLLVDGYLSDSGSQGALGVDDLRWHRPVRPGDVLRLRSTVEDKGPWGEGLGLVRSRVELYATDGADDPDPFDDGKMVLSYVALGLFERKDA
jgi:acyl dehydratase